MHTLRAKYLPKGQGPTVKKKSSIAMSPVILLPTTPSNVTCQKHDITSVIYKSGTVALIMDFILLYTTILLCIVMKKLTEKLKEL